MDDLSIRAVIQYGHPIMEILKQDGIWVLLSNTTNEFLTFNGQKLNEALVPISPDDLANRFLNMPQKQTEKSMKIQKTNRNGR